MIRPAIRRAVRGAMRFAMNSNTPRYEQIATGNVVRAMADRVYLDASASGTSDTYNNTHQLAITGGTGSGQSGLVNDYVVDSVTNLLIYSEQLDNAAWVKYYSSVTANSAISPDGTLSADKIIEDTTASQQHRIHENITISAGGKYTLSVYAKAGERNWVHLLIWNTTHVVRAWFDLSTGTKGIATSVDGLLVVLSSYAIEPDKNGYYRISLTVDVDPSITNLSCGLQLSTANGNTTYTGDGTSGAYWWGAQLNIGSTAQEYVPTIATAVTETVRVAHVSGDFTTIPQGPADSTYAINKILGVP